MRRYRAVELSVTALSLLTAIVVVADWIDSDIDLFPLCPPPTDAKLPAPDSARTRQRVRKTWTALDLPPGWVAEAHDTDADELFGARFGRDGWVARLIQVAAISAAREQPGPGLVIVEAPMEMGKTEAALLAAEVMASRSGADGAFVALPTQATTDAIYGRGWTGRWGCQRTRAAALLTDRTHIRLPGEINRLVRRTDDTEHLGPDTWQPRMNIAADTARTESAERAQRAQEFRLGE